MTDPFADFQAAMERQDVDAAVRLFAPDCTFSSPVVHAPYVGPEALRLVLGGVVRVFEDFRYTASYAGDDGHVLAFRARVGDRALQGVDVLHATDGRLDDLTVLVRPLSAALALREQMAALLS